MRIGVWLALFLWWASAGAAQVNFENVLLLQTEERLLSDPEWQQAWLAAVDPALLRKMKRHGRDDWTARQLRQLEKNLKQRRKKLLREGLELERRQQLVAWDEQRQGVYLNPVFHRYRLVFQGKGGNNRYFGRAVELLLLNPGDAFTLLPFDDESAWREWQQIREIEHGKQRAKTVFVRYKLEPGRLVQPGVLEVAIRGYEVEVQDYVERKRIHQKHWQPDMEALRRANPLGQGFGTRLVPIHSLMIDGMALGEVMVYFGPDACREQAPLAGHRLFVCTREYRNIRKEYVYLDGQMARMRQYQAVHDPEAAEKSLVRKGQRMLGYPHDTWRAAQWRKGRSMLRSVDLPEQAAERWLYFEATHGEVPGWLGESYGKLP